MGKNTAIIFLEGKEEDKEKFNKIVRNKLGYYTWNDNPIQSIFKYLGWGVEDQGKFEYREFESKLYSLANQYFDYPEGYFCRKIEMANKDEKCNILIFHDVNQELAEKISGECENLILQINLTDVRKETTDGKNFEMNVNDAGFESDISTILKVLTT